MECIVLSASGALRTAWQWRLEDLGADWRCVPAARADAALAVMADQPVQLAVLCPGAQSEALLARLKAQPLLSPPYLLGEDFDAPDGPVGSAESLPARPKAWKHAGQLPSLCRLRLVEAEHLARGMLRALGVPPGLRAWDFLPQMAGLTAVHPPLLTDLQHGLYPLSARLHGMTPAAVERGLRLLVEATWNRGDLDALERFFGSSVDPERGKPTNREFLCRVQERIVLAARRLQGTV